MMHKTRVWCVSTVESAEELARMLTERTWTLCSGFSIRGHEHYVFLNDATHEDGAAEFAACKTIESGRYLQVESITYSWCTFEEALDLTRRVLDGELDQSDFAHPLTLKVEAPGVHRRCHLCA